MNRYPSLAILRILSSVLVVISACFFLAGCVYTAGDRMPPAVEAPSFSTAGAGGKIEDRWWQGFADPLLNSLIDQALAGSFSLQEVAARVRQAEFIAKQSGVLDRPMLDADLAASASRSPDGAHAQRYSGRVSLAWEADLWQRLSAGAKAAALETTAVGEELAEAALALTARLTETYFELVEARRQQHLLAGQIELAEKRLSLNRLRFANGLSSLVDVSQARQQLAALHSRQPVLDASIRLLSHRLAVLAGKNPSAHIPAAADHLPDLPLLPDLGVPADLLTRRPDLKRLQARLMAADQRLAEAVAERLPQLKLTGRAGLDGAILLRSEDLFVSILAEVTASLFDHDRRKNEVERRKAVLDQVLAQYSQAYLVAIGEVEDALWQERQELRLAGLLRQQLALAGETLAQTRARYSQGLSDYLPVLVAEQAEQELSHDLLLSRLQAVLHRVQLIRALGGGLGFLQHTNINTDGDAVVFIPSSR